MYFVVCPIPSIVCMHIPVPQSLALCVYVSQPIQRPGTDASRLSNLQRQICHSPSNHKPYTHPSLSNHQCTVYLLLVQSLALCVCASQPIQSPGWAPLDCPICSVKCITVRPITNLFRVLACPITSVVVPVICPIPDIEHFTAVQSPSPQTS